MLVVLLLPSILSFPEIGRMNVLGENEMASHSQLFILKAAARQNLVYSLRLLQVGAYLLKYSLAARVSVMQGRRHARQVIRLKNTVGQKSSSERGSQ